MAYCPTKEDAKENQIVQDFYDRLGAEDLTFYEALSILEKTGEKLKAEMYHRHINEIE